MEKVRSQQFDIQGRLGIGSANGNRTRILALKGLRANRCTIAPPIAAAEIHRKFVFYGQSGKLTTRYSKVEERQRSALAVLEFLVPGHLDGFEFGFVGGGRIAGEARKLGDPFVHVGETHREGIGVRKFVRQRDGDVFDGVPVVGWRHDLLLKRKIGHRGTEAQRKKLN